MNQISKIINWYFSKKTLPFWGIVLLDSLIVLFSYYLVFWFFFRGFLLFRFFLRFFN